MEGLHTQQFRELVVRPTLTFIGLWSPARENLLIGTALQESRLHYLKQLGKGPALSVYQIEPRTYQDLYDSYLAWRPDMQDKVDALCGRMNTGKNKVLELVGNLNYATAMAAVFYRRVKEALPPPFDAQAMAAYYKRYYNTPAGKATVEGALPFFKEAVDGYAALPA